MVMGHHRPQVDEFIFIHHNLVQAGHAGDIDQNFDAFADAALNFQDQVGCSSHNARTLAVLCQEFKRFVHACDAVVFLPHTSISKIISVT